MTSVTYTVNKANVFTEVAKTTSYTGVKKAPDGSLYEQIFTTDEDRLLLERFWNEAANAATELFKPFVENVSSTSQAHGVDLANNYVAELSLSSSYDTSLTNSVQSSLFSFFVNYIVSKWYRFANKDEAAEFETEAEGYLQDVRSKIYFKKKPSRPSLSPASPTT